VTLEAVTNLTEAFLESVRTGGEVTEEAATEVVESLSTMMQVTQGGASGKEVAAALVEGVELVGSTLLSAKEVGAPPTEVVSEALQISVAKRDPELLGSAPFTVPTSPSGKTSVAQVVVPDGITAGLDLGAGEAVGTTLWSSTADNVHGVDMGVARAGSPTLSFSLSANGTELRIQGLLTPIQLLTLTLTLTLTLSLSLTLTRTRTRTRTLNQTLTLTLTLTLTITTGLATPIQLKLDLYEAIDPASTCVGPPTGQVSTQ